MNPSRALRRRHRLPPPQGRRPVAAYSARELEALLVDDGARRYVGTGLEDERRYLAWVVAACTRIAALRGERAETVFCRIDGTVRERCGLPLRRG